MSGLRRRAAWHGGVALIDHDTFEVIAPWELDQGAQLTTTECVVPQRLTVFKPIGRQSVTPTGLATVLFREG